MLDQLPENILKIFLNFFRIQAGIRGIIANYLQTEHFVMKCAAKGADWHAD